MTDELPPEHPASADPPVSAGEVLSDAGSGAGTHGRAEPSTAASATPRAARSAEVADERQPRRDRGDAAPDDDLDVPTLAEGIGDFLDPTAQSPAADADAPPPG